jgi:hypothetical protein
MTIDVNSSGFSVGRTTKNTTFGVTRDWKSNTWGLEWSKRI